MWKRFAHRPLDLYIAYRALALTWAFMPFQVYFLQARGLTLADVFDLNVVFTLATVALEVPTGIFADRHGRRPAMALSGVVMALACALFVAGGDVTVYAAANVLCALSMTLASGADSAWLFDHLVESGEKARYARLEGLSTAAKGIGNLAAVLVGGVIFAVAPWGVFAFTGALTLAAAAVALALPEHPRAVRDGSSAADDVARAARVVARDGRLIAVMAFSAVTFVLLRISLFADPAHLEVHLTGRAAQHLALAAALLAAGKEIGGAVVASSAGGMIERAGARALVCALAAFAVLAYAVMGLGHGVVDVVAMVLLAAAFGLFSPLMRALMNRAIPGSRDRATLLSFESMGRRLLFAAASPLFGRAVESSSLHAAFTGTAWVAAGAYVVLAALALGVLRAMAPAARRRASEPPGSALVSAAG